MADSVFDAVVSHAARRILEKLEKGKKLTVEDLLLLHLDLQYRELRELRGGLDSLRRELLERLEALRREVTLRMEELGRRVDRLYELRAGEGRG
ncbi:MAG: hypothetical protein GXO15_00350 [Crenarchaeota archaeon]|nr:hypothetical protein [Thermoproteota archaeon]